jgi:hypothetical protein
MRRRPTRDNVGCWGSDDDLRVAVPDGTCLLVRFVGGFGYSELRPGCTSGFLDATRDILFLDATPGYLNQNESGY